jgi:hypothetical protein
MKVEMGVEDLALISWLEHALLRFFTLSDLLVWCDPNPTKIGPILKL